MVITTVDGVEVRSGDRVFNYYDRKAGTIEHQPDSSGWFDVKHDDGTRAYLNGERICSLAFAARKGWVNAVSFEHTEDLDVLDYSGTPIFEGDRVEVVLTTGEPAAPGYYGTVIDVVPDVGLRVIWDDQVEQLAQGCRLAVVYDV